MLKRLFRTGEDPKVPLRPLYAAIVAEARRPAWYAECGVPDTLDGRFDMVALILTLVLLRLEREGDAGRAPATHLAELFVDDMDPQLRQLGIGDLVVGKHVGRMMGALGGRLTAYRAALGGDAALGEALVRNLWRGSSPSPDSLLRAEERVRACAHALAMVPLGRLLAGEIGR